MNVKRIRCTRTYARVHTQMHARTRSHMYRRSKMRKVDRKPFALPAQRYAARLRLGRELGDCYCSYYGRSWQLLEVEQARVGGVGDTVDVWCAVRP